MLWWTLRQLKSNYAQKRVLAARKLGGSKENRAVEPLILALKDKNIEVRVEVAKALGQIGNDRAVAPLVATLKDWLENRETVVEALRSITPKWAESEAARTIFSDCVASLKNSSSDVRATAATVLGYIGGDRALMCLLDSLADENRKVREDVAGALTRANPNWRRSDAAKAAIPEYAALLQANSNRLREAAADALGKVGDPLAMEPLLSALHDNNKDVRRAVAAALGDIGNKGAVAPLIQTLKDTDVADVAAMALGKLGDARAIEPLDQILNDLQQRISQAEASVRVSSLFGGQRFSGAGIAGEIANQAIRNLEQTGTTSRANLSNEKRLHENLVATLKSLRALQPIMAAQRDAISVKPPAVKNFTIVELKPQDGELTPLLKAEVKKAKESGRKPFVEFYADWCGPSRALRNSLDAPLMIEAFEGTYIIQLDLETWKHKLAGTNFSISAVPVLFELNEDGRPTGRSIDGGAWGANTPPNMAPPLRKFFKG